MRRGGIGVVPCVILRSGNLISAGREGIGMGARRRSGVIIWFLFLQRCRMM